MRLDKRHLINAILTRISIHRLNSHVTVEFSFRTKMKNLNVGIITGMGRKVLNFN